MMGLRNAWDVWRAAVKEDRERPKISRVSHELEFMPAALEVLETPASPFGRIIVWMIVLLFVVAIVWAWFGRIDTVAIAQGRIITGERVKLVQPLEIGKVRSILVEENQFVRAGQPLIVLDPTEQVADRDRLQRDLLSTRLDAARYRAMTQTPETAIGSFSPPDTEKTELVEAAAALLRDQLAEHDAELAAIESEILQNQAEQSMIQASIARLEQMLPLLAERVEGRRQLMEKDFGTKVAFLELQQELFAMEGELNVERYRLAENAAAVDALRQRREQVATSFRAAASEKLAEALLAINGMEQELLKLDQRYEDSILRAPVDGIVQQLAIHTIGGVVSPAEPLMVIVPANSDLIIEAMVLNKDIGFVKEGQEAKIKVESFPFTKYGLIEGQVLEVSADAIENEQLGLVYSARVSMNTDQILVDDRWIQLSPGMAVSVEVTTGNRRAMEYFLSPFLRYQDEALRER